MKKCVRTLPGALKEAELFIHASEICSSSNREPRRADEVKSDNYGKKKEPRKNETWEVRNAKKYQSDSRKRERTDEGEFEYSKDLHSILMEVKGKLDIADPPPMRAPTETHDKTKFCHFRKDIGHETNNCRFLKRSLDGLAAKGTLNSYLRKGNDRSYKKDRSAKKSTSSDETGQEVVAVISGGFAAGGPTLRGNKDYVRNLSQVMLSGKAEKEVFPKVEIFEDDRGAVRTPHDDPLVIEMKIANLKVRRILIDTGSSSDIISLSCLEKLKFDENSLTPIHHPIIGFGGSIIHPVGVATLPVRIGEKEKGRNLFVKFLVVKDLIAYNVILGRPTLNPVKAVVVTHLMLMKYECNDGTVGATYGDQRTTRECYMTTLKPTAWGADRPSSEKKRKEPERSAEKQEFMMTNLPQQEAERPQSADQIQDFVLDPARPERVIKVGCLPDEQLGASIRDLLREYQDVFAFQVEEMPGIDPSVAVYQLNVDPSVKPVRQKKRNHREARDKAAAEEVKKLLNAGYIRQCFYPEWVANVVLIPKPNGS